MSRVRVPASKTVAALATLGMLVILLPATRAQHRIDRETLRALLAETEAKRVMPELAKDIEALKSFHGVGKTAAGRLVERGDEMVPRLVEALRSPEANEQQRVQIITVLGEIGDIGAVQPLIDVVRNHPQWLAERKEALFALSFLPRTEASSEFSRQVLDNEDEHPRIRRTALVYLAQQRDPSGSAYVEKFRSHSNVELRGVALYLGARLGDLSVKDPSFELLALPAPRSIREPLLLGLAEVADPGEIERRVPRYLKGTKEYVSALRYARFRTGTATQRSELAREMLDAGSFVEKHIAAKFILDEQGAEALAELAGLEVRPDIRAVMRHTLRRAGYRVTQEKSRMRLERRTGS